MRLTLISPLAVAGSLVGFAIALGAEHQHIPFRKTLSFGPVHPHASFVTTPQDASHNTRVNKRLNPLIVARMFLDNTLLAGVLSLESEYKIRDDSYTDKSTKITHVYVQQFLNGLEVINGDININIRNGEVLSYGDSFYRGHALKMVQNGQDDSHVGYCTELYGSFRKNLRESWSQEHIETLSPDESSSLEPMSQLLSTFDYFSKKETHVQSSSTTHSDGVFSPKAPLLQLMAAITPLHSIEEGIKVNFDHWLNQLALVDNPSNRLDSDAADTVYVAGLPGAVDPVKARLVYIQVPNRNNHDTQLILVWKFVIKMQYNWYEASVSAASPHCIISIADRVWDSSFPVPDNPSVQPATYEVFQWGVNNPSEGPRTIEKELFDPLASPAGWHSLPISKDPSLPDAVDDGYDVVWRNTTTTWGNNIFAQENWDSSDEYLGHHRPDGGKAKKFQFPYAPEVVDSEHLLDEVKKRIDFTLSQVFYTANVVHDIFHRYGFDEVAGNYQQYNFGLGGKDNDAIIVGVQQGPPFNLGNFWAGVDGENGRLNLYIFDTAIPFRDSALDAGVVVHELSHGLTSRLTGGPSRSDCLRWSDAPFMAEGWSDFFAIMLQSTEGVTQYTLGAWSKNTPAGVRKFPYSLNKNVNPLIFSSIDGYHARDLHSRGEVWAEMLWIVSQKLVAKHGFSANMYPPAPPPDGGVGDGSFYKKIDGVEGLIPKHGNTLSIQLVMNALKDQICSPSIFQARDAILSADHHLTGGENFCEIWNGFAERGLGEDADFDGSTRTNSFKVPDSCSGKFNDQSLFTMKVGGRIYTWLKSKVGWW